MSDIQPIELTVLPLRYSSWSIRPWLALHHAIGDGFETRTIELDSFGGHPAEELDKRRALGSVTGHFPVLRFGPEGVVVHESLAICEWAAETFPEAALWPEDSVARARARAISSEMHAGFPKLRTHLSCHPFARVPGYQPPDDLTHAEIARVFEIWREALAASGGPFLFGAFGIADCMYFPVVTRFRTYDVTMPDDLEAYAERLEAHPSVLAWRNVAKDSPRIEQYDLYIQSLGGDPDAALP